MIPKILHFIWLGNLDIPTCVNTWITTHTDWDIHIWDENAIKKLELVNSEIYNIPNNKYNQKSDIARLEILYKYGGVYVDSDIINFKKINTLLTHDTFFVQEKLGLISNSIIGSIPKNDILYKMINHIKLNFSASKAVWKTTGPGVITTFLKNNRLIYIPKSHSKYDIKSLSDKLTIYPYYYINFMTDAIKIFRHKPFKISELNNMTRNKDLKYLVCNKVNVDKIYGVQLWMGGKVNLYSQGINIDFVRKNINKYMKTIID